MPSVICPLFEESYYSYSIDLGQEAYTLTFRYNERELAWKLKIEDSEENVIIESLSLVPTFRLLEQYSLQQLSGEFLLLPYTGNTLADSGIENTREIYKTHFLVYIYE